MQDRAEQPEVIGITERGFGRTKETAREPRREGKGEKATTHVCTWNVADKWKQNETEKRS